MSLKNYFEANLLLGVDDKTRHWTYFGAKRTASIHTSDHSGGTVTCQVRIHNGRGSPHLKLDDSSFELVNCPTALSTEDFYALQNGYHKLKDKYYEEVENLVKKKLGCDDVKIMHHLVRNEDRVSEHGIEGYANSVPHTDSSPVSADELAVHLLNGDTSEYSRYLYLNLWRNISDVSPIQNDHLAMLDERTTVKPDDYITKDLFGEGYSVVQYSLSARHADRHKWYYFPQMTKDEGILFKQMDSDYTKSGRICFHTSAHDDSVTDHATRESIELRMMCYWKKSNNPNQVNSMPAEANINVAMIKDPLQVALDMSTSSFTLNSFTLLKRFVMYIFSGLFNKGYEAAPYTGNPKDYEDRFLNGIQYVSFWPKNGKTWAKGVMDRHETPEQGIAEITTVLVDDVMNYNKTKHFDKANKKEIVDYLLQSTKYMEVAEKALTRL